MIRQCCWCCAQLTAVCAETCRSQSAPPDACCRWVGHWGSNWRPFPWGQGAGDEGQSWPLLEQSVHCACVSTSTYVSLICCLPERIQASCNCSQIGQGVLFPGCRHVCRTVSRAQYSCDRRRRCSSPCFNDASASRITHLCRLPAGAHHMWCTSPYDFVHMCRLNV